MENNFEERKKILEEILASGNSNFETLIDSMKEGKKSSKSPTEKLESYNFIVYDIVFWASRQVYLKLIQSFLSKKIDGRTLESQFFELRINNMKESEELCRIIEDQILPIPDFCYTCKAKDFGSIIEDIYFEIKLYSPDIDDQDSNDFVFSESKLRSILHEDYVSRLEFQDWKNLAI